METKQNDSPEPKPRKTFENPSQWLRDAARRRDARGETAAAILFRNEACRMEGELR